jgi:glycosyltransferase involved in cell wall biosynthesis
MAERRLLCVLQLPPPVHGTTVINKQVAESELLRSHFDVEVLPMHFTDSINDIGRPSARKLGKALRVAGSLAMKLAKQRPDAVYFTISPVGSAFLRDCLYVAIMKAARVQRIYHLHGKGIAGETDRKWKRELYRWAFRGARVIHLSPLLAYDIKDVVDRDSLKFVANGVVASNGAPDIPRAPTGPVRFTYLSTMKREKGHLVLVEALGRLRKRGVDFQATFAGSDAGDGSLADFERRVRELELQDAVSYVGPVYGEAKNELLARTDVFVFPTFYAQEAFPLVLLEAMQFGCAVVSTYEGAIGDIVREGETGMLVRQQDAAALSGALEQLANDRATITRMGRASREAFWANYTAEHLEQRMLDVLTAWVPKAR